MSNLKLTAESKYVLESFAEELERIGETYLKVKMTVPAAVYYDIAQRLRKVVAGKVRPDPRIVFSHPIGPSYYSDGESNYIS